MGALVEVRENGFVIEAEGKKLRVSYEEFCGSHSNAMKFCKEQGGGDETVENLQLIARYRDTINEELRKLGKGLILGWYWANEIAWWSTACAFVIYMKNESVDDEDRSDINRARAVFAL